MQTGIKSSSYVQGSGYQQNDGLCFKMGRKEAEKPLEPSVSSSPCQTILAKLSPWLNKPA